MQYPILVSSKLRKVWQCIYMITPELSTPVVSIQVSESEAVFLVAETKKTLDMV